MVESSLSMEIVNPIWHDIKIQYYWCVNLKRPNSFMKGAFHAGGKGLVQCMAKLSNMFQLDGCIEDRSVYSIVDFPIFQGLVNEGKCPGNGGFCRSLASSSWRIYLYPPTVRWCPIRTFANPSFLSAFFLVSINGRSPFSLDGLFHGQSENHLIFHELSIFMK